jgi:hypothetical protein
MNKLTSEKTQTYPPRMANAKCTASTCLLILQGLGDSYPERMKRHDDTSRERNPVGVVENEGKGRGEFGVKSSSVSDEGERTAGFKANIYWIVFKFLGDKNQRTNTRDGIDRQI